MYRGNSAARWLQAGTDSGTLGSSRSLHLDWCGGPWHHAERAGAWGQGTRHLWQTTRPAVTHTSSSLLQEPTQQVLFGHHSHPPRQSFCTRRACRKVCVGRWERRGCGCMCRCNQELECSELPAGAVEVMLTAGQWEVQTTLWLRLQSVPPLRQKGFSEIWQKVYVTSHPTLIFTINQLINQSLIHGLIFFWAIPVIQQSHHFSKSCEANGLSQIKFKISISQIPKC